MCSLLQGCHCFQTSLEERQEIYDCTYAQAHTHIPICILETYIHPNQYLQFQFCATESSLPSSIPCLHLFSLVTILAPNNTNTFDYAFPQTITHLQVTELLTHSTMKNKPRKQICLECHPTSHHTCWYIVKYILYIHELLVRLDFPSAPHPLSGGYVSHLKYRWVNLYQLAFSFRSFPLFPFLQI